MTRIDPPTREGAFAQLLLDDGREVCVYARGFNATLTVGPPGDEGYDSHWCYETPIQALVALYDWAATSDPEPEGWFRHAATGRRRPDGDASREYRHF